jgi:hypothetical protein
LRRADFGRCGHFNQFSRTNIIHVAVHRYGPRNERVIADASDIGDHAAGFVRERQPIDKVTRVGSRALADILSALITDLCSFEAALQKPSDNGVGKKCHSAIGVMDDEPLLRSQQLVGNHK